jgi:hypothetical protein
MEQAKPFQDVPSAADQDKPMDDDVKPTDVLATRPIMQIDISPLDPSEMKPADSSVDLAKILTRDPVLTFNPKIASWVAPGITYQPLYFEDVPLERYGQTFGLLRQPWVSGARFLADGLVLPYNVFVQPPRSCDTPLGYCRPGSPTCDVRQRIIRRK